MRLYFRLLRYLKPYWKLLLVVFLCLLIPVGLGLLPTYITAKIVDKILVPIKPIEDEVRSRLLVIYVILLVLASAATHFAQFFYRYLRAVVEQSVTHDFRNGIYRSLKTLPDSFFESKGAGDVMSRNIGDVGVLGYLIYILLDGTRSILFILGMGVILFITDWKIASVSLAIMLLLVPIVFLLGRSIRRNFLLAREARGILNHFLFSKLSPADLNGRMAMAESEEAEVFDERSNTFKQHNITVAKLFAALYAITGFAIAVIGVVLWIYGGGRILSGHLTLGTLIVFKGYASRFGNAVSDLGYHYAWIQRLSAPAERVFEILDTAAES